MQRRWTPTLFNISALANLGKSWQIKPALLQGCKRPDPRPMWEFLPSAWMMQFVRLPTHLVDAILSIQRSQKRSWRLVSVVYSIITHPFLPSRRHKYPSLVAESRCANHTCPLHYGPRTQMPWCRCTHTSCDHHRRLTFGRGHLHMHGESLGILNKHQDDTHVTCTQTMIPSLHALPRTKVRNRVYCNSQIGDEKHTTACLGKIRGLHKEKEEFIGNDSIPSTARLPISFLIMA